MLEKLKNMSAGEGRKILIKNGYAYDESTICYNEKPYGCMVDEIYENREKHSCISLVSCYRGMTEEGVPEVEYWQDFVTGKTVPTDREKILFGIEERTCTVRKRDVSVIREGMSEMYHHTGKITAETEDEEEALALLGCGTVVYDGQRGFYRVTERFLKLIFRDSTGRTTREEYFGEISPMEIYMEENGTVTGAYDDMAHAVSALERKKGKGRLVNRDGETVYPV